MASTYSNIKIQLMATGENTTTWGDVTNVNLGTALEEAIVGSASVAFSNASVTLTLTDTNATQSARNMRLNLTGTATSGYNLVVPAIQKPYIINNGTDGTITVKNSTGSGTAVPAGKTLWVYNNGTDVVDAVTHLTSLTLGTALPVLSGGTGSNTASGARTNLGLGTIATQNSNAVTITGGSITGITDLAIADGGTGASTKLVAFDNLSPLTTKGDLIGYDGTDNVRLAVGTNGQVLTANSSATTGLSWATASSGSGFSNIQVFTSSGTFTVPTGITKVKATVVGGGGGGSTDGSGGGGGGAAIEIVSGLTPGNTVTTTVGAAGTAGTGGNGGTGGTSSFGAFCSATGGAGGVAGNSNGGLGGLGSGGDLNIRGGGGGTRTFLGCNAVGGFGGSSILGGGGPSGETSATAGGAYGGGGSASPGGLNGAAGAAGVVIVEW